ncbi:hypothetical protein Daura_38485 [Dactylosporangium aurantiacum]|uniref:Uncharacterized protein n=1 Tax=Dactylosporangium aurantiacum TaxID=35754 RepID=A0A9Q9IEC8_9ACTN|nr:DUF6343 family protein [Dactylosporangium aurantiacum]MDG6101690.1 DUF6343 family protein [Dactylosporangium aurantiacum]UWZ52492.1 hypothetical protein Daura_38485 [Dactylosporangium aurantiacum]
MPLDAQPPRRRGTVGHPYSALNLRLVLATFGLVMSVVFAVLLFRAGLPLPAWLFVLLAAVSVVDLVVVQRRRRARGGHHSLFE